MPTTSTLQRRLIRTKEAASYLSMSDWKLRRLIQEGTFPVVQAHEEDPSSSMYAIWTATWKATSARSRTSFQHARNSRLQPQTTLETERGGRDEASTRYRKNLPPERQHHLVDEVLSKR